MTFGRELVVLLPCLVSFRCMCWRLCGGLNKEQMYLLSFQFLHTHTLDLRGLSKIETTLRQRDFLSCIPHAGVFFSPWSELVTSCEVKWVLNGYFFQLAHFFEDVGNKRLDQVKYQIQYRGHSYFPQKN